MSSLRRALSRLGAAALAIASVAVSVPLPAGAADVPAPLPKLVTSIPLPGVTGRLDHLAIDRASGRLFVAALGNGTIEVLDVGTKRSIARLRQAREPQGVLYLVEPGTLFVTDGEGASVELFRGTGLQHRGHVVVRQDPDNVRFDPRQRRVWIGEGTGRQGALAALRPEDGAVVFEIPLDGHPESFQLESAGPRIFVNVPARHEVVVVDRVERRVVERWKLPCGGNFPMATDEPGRRILVGCRRPPELLVIDARSGAVTARLPAPADLDDVFVDRSQARIYASAGAGVVRVYRLPDHAHPELAGDVPTRAGARTSLFDSAARRLYVAVPRTDDAPAEIRVYDTGP